MVKSAYPFIINEKAASQSGTYVGSFTEDSVRRQEKPRKNTDRLFSPFLIGSSLKNFLLKIKTRYIYKIKWVTVGQ